MQTSRRGLHTRYIAIAGGHNFSNVYSRPRIYPLPIIACSDSTYSCMEIGKVIKQLCTSILTGGRMQLAVHLGALAGTRLNGVIGGGLQ